MKTKLYWKRGIFNNTYKIYSENNMIGCLKERSLSQLAEGEINGKRYTYKTKGFLNQKTQIIDAENNKLIGRITYGSLNTKAKIEYSENIYNWKYNNIWNTKWSILAENIHIDYKGSSTKGEIEYDKENDLLVLTGLFITNYYWQISIAVMVAIFIPVWLAVLN